MQITIVEESSQTNWENYLNKASGGPFLSAPWLESFRESKCVPVYFRFVSENDTVGLAAGLSLEPPHPFLRKIFRKLFLFSGPAFVQSNPEMEKACVSELIKYASSNQYSHFELRSYDYPHSIDFHNLPVIKEDREEFIINLNLEWSEITKKMRRMIPKQTRKAEQKGLSFHEGQSPELIEDLVALLQQTKQVRLSKGYKDYDFYYMPYLNKQVLIRSVENEATRLFYVKTRAKTVCILTIITYNRKAYALIIGANKEAYELQAQAFLTFNLLKKLKSEGFEYLNLGGVPADQSKSNIIFTKTSYGAVPHHCSGGKTPHLNGRFYNLLNIAYSKIPETKIKSILKKSLSGIR